MSIHTGISTPGVGAEKPLQKRSARSWDSYKDTLYTVLEVIQPIRCFEWGAGLSTKIMGMYPTVMSVDSVEHDHKYMSRILAEPKNRTINYIFCPELTHYAAQKGRYDLYDLVFVDGRRRFKCLMNARNMVVDEGVVMLHDAEREWYHRAVQSYPYFLFTDEGSTAVMTRNKDAYERIKHIVSADSL